MCSSSTTAARTERAALVRSRAEFVEDVALVEDVESVGAVEASRGAGGAGPELRLLAAPHHGKGSAVRAGMLAASGDLIVFTDADMATPPDQLPKMIEALATVDVALGSRIQPDGSDMRASQPPFRQFVGKVFRLAARIWVTGPIEDTQCGLQGVPARSGAGSLRPVADHEHRLRRGSDLPWRAAGATG